MKKLLPPTLRPELQRRKGVLLSLILLSFQPLFSQVNFEGVATRPRINNLIYDLHTANKMFALTDLNHLITSPNLGQSWEVLYVNDANMNALKIADDGNSLTYGTQDGLFRFDLTTLTAVNLLPSPLQGLAGS